MNYLTLKTELALPLYLSMSDQQAADELNKQITIIKPKKLTTLQILDLLGATDGAAFLVALEGLVASNDIVRLATRSIDSEGVDVGNVSTIAMLDSFVAGNLITSAIATKLKASANVTTTRAEEIGLGLIQSEDVRIARVQ